MLKSDQSVLRLELEEDKAQPDYVYAALPAYDTHNNEVWVSFGTAAKWKVSASPPRSTVRNNFLGAWQGGPTQIDSSLERCNGRIYVLKQPI